MLDDPEIMKLAHATSKYSLKGIYTQGILPPSTLGSRSVYTLSNPDLIYFQVYEEPVKHHVWGSLIFTLNND